MDRNEGRSFAPMIMLTLLILIGTLYGCANRVAPDGGPYDVTPPKLVSSNPSDKSLNVKSKKITLTFDEYVQIKDISTKVIISPPQLQLPKVMAVGKKVHVELEDDLIPNTTYTIDFTDAIVDNNEENPLENFSFAFSTGDQIDTMEISGKVLNMRNLEPMQGILVGIHPENAGRAAFTDTTFLRMSRTGDKAQFIMRNIKQGSYRVYALKENDGNYRHDMATEGVAFLDSLITTSSMAATRQDTTWVDSLTIDTITTVSYTRYLPDNLVLMYFEPEGRRKFISKRERPDSLQLKLTFNSLPRGEVTITPLDSIYKVSDTARHSKPALDMDPKGIVTAYFTDPIWKRYKEFEVSYQSIDSLQLPVVVRDSIVLKAPAPAKAKETPKDSIDLVTKKNPLELRIEHKGEGGLSDSILFTSSLPIDTTAFKAFELFNANDSILQPVPIDSIWMLPGRSTVGIIKAKLAYNTSYELYVDSIRFSDVYGHQLSKTVVDAFKLKPKDEFSQLTITISGVTGPFIGELLSAQDVPIRTVRSVKPELRFTDLKPDKYGFRLIIDKNNNGMWDTGNYRDSLQPEQVYYMPKLIEVMKNWDVKETMSPLETPIDKQKPAEMIKNKPKDAKRKDRNKEREEQLRQQRQGGQQNDPSMGEIGGMGGFGGMMGGMMGGMPR